MDVAITAPENVSVRVTVNGKVAGKHRPQLRPVKRGPDILR